MEIPKAGRDQLQYAWQNHQPRRDAVRIGALIKSLIKAERLEEPASLAQVCDIWQNLLGEQFSGHTRLEGLHNGILRVVVDSAAHMAELKMMVSDNLAEQMTARLEQKSIKSIRLRLGH